MSSPSAVLVRPRPRVHLAPLAQRSDGDDACFLSAGYGLRPDQWQADILEDWLGRRRDGRYAAATCGLAVPRQNGKNALIEMRELFGMVELGEKFLHTAHEVKTARKAFLRLMSFFDNPRQHPEMAALVKEIRRTNGQEAVVLDNGGSVEFIARSKGSGRGFTVDVLVCDEAQDLTDEQLAALLPTISAAPLGNPQVILTGTPPDPDRPTQGEVFRRVRADGENRRDKHLCWDDFGIADGLLPNVDDRGLWAQHNPGHPMRLSLAEMARERALMSAEDFAQERLGWWGDPAGIGAAALSMARWLQLMDPNAERGIDPVFGVDVTEDREAWVAVAWRRPDHDVHVMLAHDGQPMPAFRVADYVKELSVKWSGMVTGAFILKDEMPHGYVPLTSADFTVASGKFADLMESGGVRHGNQPALNHAVKAARWRSAGTGGERAFQLRDAPEVGPLAAAARALHVLTADVRPFVL